MVKEDVAEINHKVEPKSQAGKKAMELAAKPQMANFVWNMAKIGAMIMGLGVLTAIVKLATSSQAISALLEGFFSIIGGFMDILMMQFMPMIQEFLSGAAGLLKNFSAASKAGDPNASSDFASGIADLVAAFVEQFLPPFFAALAPIVEKLAPVLISIFFKVMFFMVGVLVKTIGFWMSLIIALLVGIKVALFVLQTITAIGTAGISFGASMAALGAGVVASVAVGVGMSMASSSIGGGSSFGGANS